MNDTIKIYLPITTELAHIFHFLYKVNNVDYWKEAINPTKINESLPCSSDNPWEIVFGHKPGFNITGFGSEQTIHFVDQANNKYKGYYCIEDKHKLSDGVSLTLDCSAALIAISTKIVDMFGGKVVLATRKFMCTEDIEEFYSSSTASFEQVERFNLNCSYQNALEKVNPLEAKDLLEMKEKGFWNDTDYSLVYALDSKYHKSYFNMQDLNKDLDINLNKNNNKKVKV